MVEFCKNGLKLFVERGQIMGLLVLILDDAPPMCCRKGRNWRRLEVADRIAGRRICRQGARVIKINSGPF